MKKYLIALFTLVITFTSLLCFYSSSSGIYAEENTSNEWWNDPNLVVQKNSTSGVISAVGVSTNGEQAPIRRYPTHSIDGTPDAQPEIVKDYEDNLSKFYFDFYKVSLDTDTSTIKFDLSTNLDLAQDDLTADISFTKGLHGTYSGTASLSKENVSQSGKHFYLNWVDDADILSTRPFFITINSLVIHDHTKNVDFNIKSDLKFSYSLGTTWKETSIKTFVIQTNQASGTKKPYSWDLINGIAYNICKNKPRTIATFALEDLQGQKIDKLKTLTAHYKFDGKDVEHTASNLNEVMNYITGENKDVSIWDTNWSDLFDEKNEEGYLGLASDKYIDLTKNESDLHFIPDYLWVWNNKVTNLEYIKCTYLLPAGTIAYGSFYPNGLHVETIHDEVTGKDTKAVVDADGNVQSEDTYKPVENSARVYDVKAGKVLEPHEEIDYRNYDMPTVANDDLTNIISQLSNTQNLFTALIGVLILGLGGVLVIKIIGTAGKLAFKKH